MTLILRPPTMADEDACRRLHRELAEEGFGFLLGDSDDWAEWLAGAEREERGIDLRPGRVPGAFLLADADGVVVGRASIRYELNDFLLRIGGHVGHAIGREYRRRGYATQVLRQSLDVLAGRGVTRVLVTCDDDNVASAKTIEACGGVLENIVDDDGVPKRRYWIG